TRFAALADQVALALETHHLHSELRAAMADLQAAQREMVDIEKLRTAGTLAASIAHDIRNILTPLQMELAEMPGPAAGAVRVQLNRFAALTHRLLAFARPGILEAAPVSVTELVARILPLIGGQAEINGVRIEVRLPPDLPPVLGDASQLEHLFVNLCLNA